VRRSLLLFCALAISATWAIAGEGKRTTAGGEEFVLEGYYFRYETAPGWNFAYNIAGAWGHHLTRATQLGAIVSHIDSDDGSGFGVGPFYEYDFGSLGKGALFTGGDLQLLGGDLKDLGLARLTARFGYKTRLGPRVALRTAVDLKKTADEQEGAGRSLDTFGAVIGLSFGSGR
jgi:hypothetical protein